MPLQDSDNFIIGRGTDSYKITYEDLKDDLNYVPPPVGTIDQPTVLEPNDGAGGGDTRYLKSDAITEIEGGGVSTCETELIQNVDELSTTDLVNASVAPDGNSTDMSNMLDNNPNTWVSWTFTTASTITCTNMPSGTEWVIDGYNIADPLQVECNWSDGSTTNTGTLTFGSPVTLQSIVMTAIGSNSSKSCGIKRILCNGAPVVAGTKLTSHHQTVLIAFRAWRCGGTANTQETMEREVVAGPAVLGQMSLTETMKAEQVGNQRWRPCCT